MPSLFSSHQSEERASSVDLPHTLPALDLGSNLRDYDDFSGSRGQIPLRQPSNYSRPSPYTQNSLNAYESNTESFGQNETSNGAMNPDVSKYRTEKDGLEQDSSKIERRPKIFRARKQLRNQLMWGLFWFLITVGLFAALGATVYSYSQQNVLSRKNTHIFNVISTGISIALGLNIANALQVMARDVRWRILSQRPRPLSEIDLYLQCDSLMVLIAIAFTTRRIRAIFVCLMVLLLNIGAQVAVAAVALTWSVEPTVNDAIISQNAPIWVMDASGFSTLQERNPDEFGQEQISHELGGMADSFNYCTISENCSLPLKGKTFATESMDYWWDGDHWTAVLLNTPPQANGSMPYGPGELSIYSSQTITSNATCRAVKADIRDADWYYAGTDVEITNVGTLANSTTYADISDSTCAGDRSWNVSTYEVGDIDSTVSGSGWYYDCCSSVSEIHGRDNDTQMPVGVAQTAAGAIIWEGFYDDDIGYQCSSFLSDTYFGQLANGDPKGVERRIAQYTISVFVASGYLSPMVLSTGDQPQQGSQLNLEHSNLMILAAALISALQLILMVISIIVTYRIAIPEDSPLAMTYRLRPLLDGLDGQGALLDGKDITRELQASLVQYQAVPQDTEGHFKAMFVVDPPPQPPSSRWNICARIYRRLFARSFQDGIYD